MQENRSSSWKYLLQAAAFISVFLVVLLGLFSRSDLFSTSNDPPRPFQLHSQQHDQSATFDVALPNGTNQTLMQLTEALLNGSLLYPDPFPDSCERTHQWMIKNENTADLNLLPRESNENAGYMVEKGVRYIEIYNNFTLFMELQQKYERCNIDWHNCDEGKKKCAPLLRFVNNTRPTSNPTHPPSAIDASYPDSLMFMNYWTPLNLWHSLYDSLLPAAMTSLLWRRDSFEQPVGWLEVLGKPNEPRVEQLPILKDLERILMLDVAKDRDVKFNDNQQLLKKRRVFEFISVGYARSFFVPLLWTGKWWVYAEPMISFYPCAAKRIRQYYNVSFQPPARERIDPLVVYLERDNENSNRLEIIKLIEELKLFGRNISCVSVNPRRLSTGEIVRLMANASAVLGTEGAAFSNILFMAPGSGVLVMENRELHRHFPSLFHLPVGRYLNHSFVNMKFTDHDDYSMLHKVDPKKIQLGMEALLRRIELNRETQLLTGKIGDFVKNYDERVKAPFVHSTSSFNLENVVHRFQRAPELTLNDIYALLSKYAIAIISAIITFFIILILGSIGVLIYLIRTVELD